MKTKRLIISIALIVCIGIQSSAQIEQKKLNVAIFVHEGVELFDFAGPGEVFVAANYQSPVIDFNVYTVAISEEMVTSQTFLKIIPNYSLDNCPKPDVIVLPGGNTTIPLAKPEVIEWIKKSHEESQITLSVCTGAFLLAKADLLKGMKATTHWGAIQGLRNSYPDIIVLEDTKFIDNGRIVTSGGVSSGTEGSLHVVNRLAGRVAAKNVAKYMEYGGWDDRVGLVEVENKLIAKVMEDGLSSLSEKELDEVPYGELFNLGLDHFEDGNIEKSREIIEYLANKYPVSETTEALSKIYKKKGKNVPPTEKEIIAKIEAGDVSAGVELYYAGRKEFPNWYIFNEHTINMSGYRLMNGGDLKGAIEVFEMNTREYPESFNTWDSLGEAHMKSGNKKLAKKYYQKSLELNPENKTATEMLEKLES